jgi:tetratricopeptide (TPR) repeat protein
MSLIRCPECSKEISSHVSACPHCGYPINIKDINRQKKKHLKPSLLKNAFIIIASIAVLIIIATSVNLLANREDYVKLYTEAFNNGDYDDAANIFSENVKGNEEEEDAIITYFENSLDSTLNDYQSNKIDYSTAMNSISLVEDTNLTIGNLESVKESINQIKKSRTAYAAGLEFEESKDYMNALKEYRKVIESDSNYKNINDRIVDVSSKLKDQVLAEAESLAKKKKYEEIIQIVNEAITVLNEDTDLDVVAEKYSVLLEKSHIKDYKSKQKVIVTNTEILIQTDNDNLKAAFPDLMSAVIKNKSKQTIVSYEVGFLAFDRKGKPIKIHWQLDLSSEIDYERVATADDVRIISGSSYGQDRGWKLTTDHKISKVLACVKTATFNNGKTWTNPYYEYWLDEYMNKYYH